MLVICTKCSGLGRIPMNFGDLELHTTCTICKGNGRLHVPVGKKLCDDCNGSGSQTIKVAGLPCKADCEKCNSTGFIDI